MTGLKKINLLKFIWYGVLLILIISVLGVVSLFFLNKIDVFQLYMSGVVVVFVTLILLLTKSRIASSESVIISQTNFAHNEDFVSLYERSPVGYLTIKSNGIIVNNNPAAANLLKGNFKEVKDFDFFDLLLGDDKTDVGVLKGKVTGGLTINDTEVSLRTFSGEVLWVLLSVFTYRNNTQRIISLIDVTDKKNIDTAKSEFVALATHQLRTPIAAIRWNTELLKKNMKESKTDDQARYLMKIERNVFRMINLINDFLSVSKIEMGTFSTSKEKVNLTELLSGIVEEFSEKITEKEITLNRKDSPAQLVVETDPRLLHIIISNLMSNAVKYLSPQGVLDLSYELKGESLEVVVSDDGIGIPQVEINRLFTKFFRASNAQSHQTEGTGLGLYVVKQSVELLGGQVDVMSSEDKGASFLVTLPVSVVSIG